MMTKTVGITGGIGSGKSFVSEVLQKMGFPVYNSDLESKRIVDTDLEIRAALNELFSRDLFADGSLDRAFLAEQIFSSDETRLRVNEIIHPKVRSYFSSWTQEQTAPVVFNEAAILFETGAYKNFDKIILVTAPRHLKIQRVMSRDNLAISEVEKRIDSQWPDEQKISFADFIIQNDGRPLLIQIEGIIGALS